MTRLRNLELPRADSDALRELHDHCQKHVRGLHDWRCETLNAYIYKLHEAGWTLQSIADPLGVTRERVRQRESEAGQEAYEAIGQVTLPPRPKLQPRKPQRPKLRPEFIQWLRQTQAVATQCRGWHGLDSPERQASEALWAAIDTAAKQGARLADIARAMDMRYYTLISGLRRHGYRTVAPSQRAYTGTVLEPKNRRKTHCVHGHEFTPENTYVTKRGHRICKACDVRRGREYYQRKKASELATITDLADRRRSA